MAEPRKRCEPTDLFTLCAANDPPCGLQIDNKPAMHKSVSIGQALENLDIRISRS